jgi:hypothetical protein
VRSLSRAYQRQLLTVLACWITGCGGHATDSARISATGGSAVSADAGNANAPAQGGTAAAGAATAYGGAAANAGGGDAGNAAPAGAGKGAVGDGGTPINSADEAVAAAFLPLWKQRQSEREPGSPSPPNAAPAPCFNCIQAQDSACGLPSSDECEAATACIQRHCLCVKEGYPTCLADDYPTDLPSCIVTCLPVGGACYRPWIDYMACETSACTAACTP